MLEVQCPNCETTLYVPKAMAGQKGRCKSCGNVIVAPPARSRGLILGALIVVLLLVTAVLGGWHIWGHLTGATPASIARKASPSVMKLYCFDPQGQQISSGSGFVVSSDGQLVTNFHVIDGVSRIVARDKSSQDYAVKGVLAFDADRDLAVLQIEGENFPSLPVADSESVSPGDEITIISSPEGFENSVSTGVVSAFRDDPVYAATDSIQFTAPVSPGSSGSPLLSRRGKVVGVTSYGRTKGNALYFAINTKHLKSLMLMASNEERLRELPIANSPRSIKLAVRQDSLTETTAFRLCESYMGTAPARDDRLLKEFQHLTKIVADYCTQSSDYEIEEAVLYICAVSVGIGVKSL